MTRIEPESGLHYVGLKSRICPRCGGYIAWEPRVNIDHGYRYFCIMCNRQFGEVFEPLIFRRGKITGRDNLHIVTGSSPNEVAPTLKIGNLRKRVAVHIA